MPTVISVSTSTDRWELLFQAALVLVISDATRLKDSPEKDEAIRWLTDTEEHGADLEETCD